LLAVHWSRLDDVLNQAGDVSGKVIVTCSLLMNNDNTDLVLAHTSSGAEALAKKVPGTEVVAAFNWMRGRSGSPATSSRSRRSSAGSPTGETGGAELAYRFDRFGK